MSGSTKISYIINKIILLFLIAEINFLTKLSALNISSMYIYGLDFVPASKNRMS